MSLPPHPPKYILRLLRWICPNHLHEEIEGDLLEGYDRDIQLHGLVMAQFQLLWSVVRFARPGIMLRRNPSQGPSDLVMFYSLLQTSIRNLKAHRTSALINGLGLAVGMCATLIVFSILRFEQSFDSFHTDADRIYRIVRVSQVEGQEEYRTGVVYPLAPAIENSLTSVERLTSLLYWDWEDLKVLIPSSDGSQAKLFSEPSGVAFVQPSFFELFDFRGTSFRWLTGNPLTALEDPFAVVLSQSFANKYFGEEDPMGKSITVNNDSEYVVTGVIADLPSNSDFPFKILFSYATLMQYVGDRASNWFSVGENQLYVKVTPGSIPAQLDQQLHEVHASHTPESLHSSRKYKVQPLSAIHGDARFGNFNHRVVSDQKFWALAIVGLFLLLAACINYINLATARASLRAREIGVRKVLGSNRRQLIFQFMMESFLLTLISGLIALLLAELVANHFRSLLSTTSSTLLISEPLLWLAFAGILLAVTLLAGLYPALIISGFSPLQALKGKMSGQGNLSTRRFLVVVQFGLTIAFIIGTTTVLRQVTYFRSLDLGFDREAIVTFDLPDHAETLEVLANELSASPLIEHISFSSTIPSGLKRPSNFWDIKRKESTTGTLVTERQFIDTTYFKLYGIEILAGRNFRPTDEGRSIIINQTLSRKLGYGTAEASIGTKCMLQSKEYEVIGVTADFHSKSLREEIDKITFFYGPDRSEVGSIALRVGPEGFDAQQTREALGHIEAAWTQVFPDDAINYQFFDDNILGFYSEELRFSSLLQIFTGLLIFIGSLGIYGLISFIVDRRMKEMAIRKTFGASTLRLLHLLSADFVRLLVIAFLIATPIAYYFTHRWLMNFTYHISVTWWMLLLPFFMVLLLATLIICGQSLRAARLNPARILRDE